MEALRIVQKMVWGPWLLGLFLAVGVLCMVRLRGFPIRHIRVWWGETVGNGGKGQLLTTCTALAATVGTGNITGVAAALAIGGPGAVFWMWAAAFLGMALAYTEVYLGILYGGGPYVYLENGAGSCFAGKCYALFCVLASLGMGCMVQAGALADSLRYAASLPPLGTGIILAVLTAVVLFGGAKRIGWTASVLVPVSAGLYLLAGGIAVFSFYDQIPEVLGKIVGGAFGLADNAGQTDGSSILNFSGISGGMTGYGMAAAIRSGVSRGVFSNEAGLGTLAVLHGPAEHTTPWEQGKWAMFEVFFDTVVLCTLTALVILCTSQSDIETFSLTGAALAAACFSARSGIVGKWFISVSMVVFAFATVIAWYYLGQQAVVYLKEKTGILHLHILYPILFLLAVFAGGCIRLEAIWMLSDLWNGLMAFFNLTALLFLSGEVCIPDHSDLFNTTKKTPHVK